MKTSFTNKTRTFSKKYITAIALLLLICGCGWAQPIIYTHTWTGEAKDTKGVPQSNWQELSNWGMSNTTIPGTNTNSTVKIPELTTNNNYPEFFYPVDYPIDTLTIESNASLSLSPRLIPSKDYPNLRTINMEVNTLTNKGNIYVKQELKKYPAEGQTPTINNSILTINTKFTNSGAITIDNGCTLVIKGKTFENKGTIINNGTIKTDIKNIPNIKGNQPIPITIEESKILTITQQSYKTSDITKTYEKIIFSGTSDQTINNDNNYKYPIIEINKTNGSVTFSGSTEISQLIDSTANNQVNITFKDECTINNSTTFNTTGTVTFNNQSTLGSLTNLNSKCKILNNLTITGNFINSNSLTSQNQAKLILKGNLTDIGSIDCPIDLESETAQFIKTKDTGKYNIAIKGTNKDVTVTFNNKINLKNFSSTRNVIFTNGANIDGDLTIEKVNITVSGVLLVDNFTNNGTLTLSGNTDIKVNDDFTDQGTISKNNDLYTINIHLMRKPTTPTDKPNQTFSAGTTKYDLIKIDQSTSNTNHRVPIIFNKNLKAKTFTDYSTFEGNITFNNSGAIDTATFNTKGIVSFITDADKNYEITKGLTHNNGKTIINGNVTASSVNLGSSFLSGTVKTLTTGQIYDGPVDIQGSIKLLADQQEITFENTIDGNSKNSTKGTLTIGKDTTNIPTKVLFTGDIGCDTLNHGTNNISSINITASEIHLPAQVKTSGPQTYNGIVKLLKDTTLLDAINTNSNGDISFNSNIISDNNAKNLTIDNANIVTFTKNITNASIKDLTVTATTINLPTNITTDGNQKITSNLKLSPTGSKLNSTKGNIELKYSISDTSTQPFNVVVSDTNHITLPASINISGDQIYTGSVKLTNSADTTIESASGNIVFGKNITGEGTELAPGSLSVTVSNASKSITLPAEVKTTGNQIYTGKLNFAALDTGTALTATNGNITFNTDIDSTAFTANAKVINLPTSIKTSGNQTYNSETITSKGTKFNGPQINLQNSINTTGDITIHSPVVITGNTTFNNASDTTPNLTLIFEDKITRNGDEDKLDLTFSNFDTVTFPLDLDIGSGKKPFNKVDLSSSENINLPKNIYANEILLARTDNFPVLVTNGTELTLSANKITMADKIDNPALNLTIALIGENAEFIFLDVTTAEDTANAANLALFTQTKTDSNTTGTGKVSIAGDIKTNKSEISFASPITLTGNVALNSNTDVVFTSNISSISDTDSLTVSTTKNITLPAKVQTKSDQSYKANQNIILANDTTLLTPQNISFSSRINSTENKNHSLTIAKSVSTTDPKTFGQVGSVTFGGNIGNTNALNILNINANTIKLPSSINTTGNQAYNGAVLLLNDTTLLSPTTIVFSSTIDSTEKTNHSLTIAKSVSTTDPTTFEPVGSITFGGNIGNTNKLIDLSIHVSNNVILPANITTSNNQTYDVGTEIQLASDTTLTGNHITITDNIGKIINGDSHSLTISNKGLLTFTDKSSNDDIATAAQLTAFSQTGTGNVSLSGDITASTGAISFNSPIDLTGNVVLNGINSISFNNTIDGTFSLNIGNKNIPTSISFKNNIGSNKSLTSLDAKATTSVTLPQIVTTTGNQTYSNNNADTQLLLATTTTTLKGTTISLFDNINSKDSKLIIESTTFNFNDSTDSSDSANASPVTIAKVNGVTVTGNLNISGDIETYDSITFNDPITLTGNVLIDNKSTKQDINLSNKSITSKQNESLNLVLSNFDNITLGDNITNLNSIDLSTTKTSITLPSSVTTKTDIKLASYNNKPKLTLASSATTTLKSTSIYLSDNIDCSSSALVLNNSGTVYFYDYTSLEDTTTNIAQLASLTQTSTADESAVELQGDINTTGNISFASPITLTGDVLLSGKANIALSKTIKGKYSLTIGDSINKPIDVTLGGDIDIGTTDNLVDLSITTSGNVIIPGNITTSNDQTYDVEKQIQLANDITLTGNNITITDNIGTTTKGDIHSLTIKNKSLLSFKDKTSDTDIDKLSSVSSFTQIGTISSSKINLSGDINATSSISFSNSPITLIGDVKLLSSDISFNGEATINGEHNLTLGDITENNPKTKNISLNGNIGNSTPIKSLTASVVVDTEGKNLIKLPSIVATTGSQTYTGNINIDTSTIKSTVDGNVTFNNKLSGNTLNIYTAKKENSITFAGAVELSALFDNIESLVNQGTITFGSTTGSTTNIASALELQTPNDVTINGAFTVGTTPSELQNLKHVTGKTIIDGTVNAADLTLAETVLNSSSENIITTTGNQTYSGPVTVSKTAKLTINPPKGSTPIITFTQNASINANSNLTFAGHTLYQGGDIKGTGLISATSGKDFVIQPLPTPAPAPSIESQITADRIIIDNSKQNIFIKNKLSANNDLAIFGSSYCTTDQESKNEGIYNYKFDSLSLPKAGSPVYPESKSFTGYSTLSLTMSDSGELSSGSIFYINGTTIKGTGTFTLPDNFNTIAKKAEAFYTDFSNSETLTINIGKLVTENCNLKSDHTFENGWDSDTYYQFEIADVHTIDDNAVYIKFNRPVRLISKEADGLNVNNGSRISYSAGSYNDTIFTADSTAGSFNQLTKTGETGGAENLSEIYITGSETWNTDATGSAPGVGTDKKGIHKDVVPYLNILRNVNGVNGYNYFITDLYGKRLKQYSGTTVYNQNPDALYDKCPPVLIAVTTGQECHTPNDLKSYDAHNFIELRYSEPVKIGSSTDLDTKLNPSLKENDKTKYDNAPHNISLNYNPVKSQLGEIKNNGTSDSPNGFTVASLGSISGGHISTSTQQKPEEEDISINTLYRKDSLSLRISLAGQTSGEKQNLEWVGFINESTIQPYGIFTVTSTDSITDYSQNKLTLDDYIYESVTSDTTTPDSSTPATPSYSLIKEPNVFLKVNINNNEKPIDDTFNDKTYGDWDLSKPVISPINFSGSQWENKENKNYEILGYATGGGTTVERLEFHMLDNTPSEANVWYSSKGWYSNNEDNPKQITACADIYGGARAFDSENQTTGGIRYHTISSDSFFYTTSTDETKRYFSTKQSDAQSSFFKGFSSSGEFAINPVGELYFSLDLEKTDWPIQTIFNVSYNQNAKSYITDLAGNKLDKVEDATSIDRTPPTFNILLSPINQNDIFVVFSKRLERELDNLPFYKTKEDSDGKNRINLKSSTYEEALKDCLKIGTISSGQFTSDTKDPSIQSITLQDLTKRDGTVITSMKLSLDRKVNFEDLTNYYLQLAPSISESSEKITSCFDPFTGVAGSRVTLLRDNQGNYMNMYSAHAISDFAINVLNPLYAYNTNMLNGEDSFMNGLYADGSWAVHDWSENQQNFGTILANKEARIVLDNNIPADIKAIQVYIDNTPDKKSLSPQLSLDLNRHFRIWIPQLTPDFVLPSISKNNNTEYKTIPMTIERKVADSTTPPDASTPPTVQPIDKLYFTVEEQMAKDFGTNQQMSFLFALSKDEATGDLFKPIMITPEPEFKGSSYDMSKQVPLYCLRLSDPSDISSIDLWSYRTKSTKLQRGGVTILNNVINNNIGEDAVVKVQIPSEGNLSIMILTLDGNIVKYLQRGKISAGEYNYYWDGTNTNDTPVARGLYFVRVIGAGIDETRKIMVVN